MYNMNKIFFLFLSYSGNKYDEMKVKERVYSAATCFTARNACR